MGYEVTIEAMRSAARAAREAAAAAGKVDLGGSVDDVATALPGSQSGAAATALARVWADRIRAWSSDAAEYGGNLDGSAKHYAAHEADAAADFQAIR